MIGVGMDMMMSAGPPRVPLITAAATEYRASTSLSSILVPAGVQAGELLVGSAFVNKDTRNQITPPAGWTRIGIADVYDYDFHAVYKIADGTEGGTEVQLFNNSSYSGSRNQCTRFTFDDGGDWSISSLIDANIQATGGNPGGQLKNVTTLAADPCLVFGIYMTSVTVSPRTWTGDDFDGETYAAAAGMPLKWKAYGSPLADITVDMADEGNNCLASVILQMSAD